RCPAWPPERRPMTAGSRSPRAHRMKVIEVLLSGLQVEDGVGEPCRLLRPRGDWGERTDDELGETDVDVALNEVAQAGPPDRHEGERVDPGTAGGERGQQFGVGGDAGVGDAHPEVV